MKDTIMRGAKTFSASLAHFDTVPTCWVCNISQRPNINVWILYYSVGWRSKITIVDAEIFFFQPTRGSICFCKPMGAKL